MKNRFLIIFLCFSIFSNSALSNSFDYSKYASASVVPLTNCALGALAMKETPHYGCALGLASGVLDEVAIAMGFANLYVFSSALIGSAVLSPVHPEAKIPGAALGVAMATGLLDHKKTFQELNLGFNALAVQKILDLPYSFTAVYSALAWNYFNQGNYTGSSEVSILPEMSVFFSKFVDEKKLREVGSRQVFTILSSQAALSMLNTAIWKGFGEFFNAYEMMGQDPNAAMARINNALRPSLALIAGYIFISTFTTQAINYFQDTLVYEAKDFIDAKYYNGETALRLSKMNETAHLIDGINADFETIRNAGALVNSELSNKVKHLYNLNIIYGQNVLDFYAVIYLYNKAVEQITMGLSALSAKLQEDLNKVRSRQRSLRSDSSQNANLIVLNQRTNQMAQKSLNMTQEERRIILEKTSIDSAFSIWNNVKGFTDFVLSNYVVAKKIQNDPTLFEERNPLISAGRDISESLGWASSMVQGISMAELAIKNIETIAEKMDSPETRVHHKIQQNFIKSEDGKASLEFLDLYIHSEDNKQSLHIPHLDIPEGFYSVTGDSGTGKSTLMQKIFNVVNNRIGARGTMNFYTPSGEVEKPFFITQDFYATPESTLFEVIAGKRKEELTTERYEHLKSRITAYFEESRIGSSGGQALSEQLDLEKDWNNSLNLSGGQRKKVTATALFMHLEEHPTHFIIIDEVFTGLDPDFSLPKMKEMMKKYVKNAVVLMVDHGNTEFFDRELNFANSTVVLRHHGS